MPQMSPVWWTPILFMSAIMTTQIMTNLEFNKNKNKINKNIKLEKMKKIKILW
uniref:ATP synthase F0 subunit 8 n=1 Tax=Symplana lii TaxID=2886252 RepID=UPI001E7D442E|nr:ATP synthase F0 subunit 8 [Symplana lii]UDL72022.1 ATP synthase F0 subunit 8 [Symplana lii]